MRRPVKTDPENLGYLAERRAWAAFKLVGEFANIAARKRREYSSSVFLNQWLTSDFK
jgi:hypothetical protein